MLSRVPYLTAVLLVRAWASPAAAQRAIILVRHAEKVAGSGDVSLSPAGKARADELAARLKAARVTAIFTSTYARRKQTAAPTASAMQLTADARPDSETPADFKTHLAAKQPSGTVLVVGHSNTVPEIVNAFVGAGTVPMIPDTEYGHLYLLFPKGDGTWGLVRAKY